MPNTGVEENGVEGEKPALGVLAAKLYAGIARDSAAMRYTVRCVAPMTESTTHELLASGQERSIRSLKVSDEAQTLRAAMYRHPAATWFSAVITVHADSSVDARFNFDDEPQWTAPIPSEYYRRDLEMFPRDQAHRPQWLNKMLAS